MITKEFEMARTSESIEMVPHNIFLRNVVKADNVHIGEFTYYDAANADNPNFEGENILYNYPGHGDLYIGKFCSIAYGVEFIMGAANHSLRSFSSYPFMHISENWAMRLGMDKEDMPQKGNTIIGNDVWLGRKARIMPGVTIGNGAVIGAYAVVATDILPYTIAVGNPAKVVKQRFDDNTIEFLEYIKWWDFEPQYLEMAIPHISTIHTTEAQKVLKKIAKMNKLCLQNK